MPLIAPQTLRVHNEREAVLRWLQHRAEAGTKDHCAGGIIHAARWSCDVGGRRAVQGHPHQCGGDWSG